MPCTQMLEDSLQMRNKVVKISELPVGMSYTAWATHGKLHGESNSRAMLGHEHDRREGVCEGTDMSEGPASFQGTEDSGQTVEHRKVSRTDLVVISLEALGESEKSGCGEHLPRFALETGQEGQQVACGGGWSIHPFQGK